MSKRIQTIVDLISPEAEQVWDLCCDHGKIGIRAYQSNPKRKIHFIDQVPNIITKLKNSIDTYIPQDFYVIKCEDVRKLVLPKNATIVMAGVGGILISQILEKLLATKGKPQQLIVCPHQDIHLVRSTLANNFGLTNEVLCFENGHGYEILNLSNNLADGIVTKIGHSMWDLSDRNHYQYALKFQQYYALKVKHEFCASYEEYFSLFNNLINSIK